MISIARSTLPIAEAEDCTKQTYEPGTEYEVKYMDIGGDPGRTALVWLWLDK
jgi:hypothetical protein